jgi:hypothetical protein
VSAAVPNRVFRGPAPTTPARAAPADVFTFTVSACLAQLLAPSVYLRTGLRVSMKEARCRRTADLLEEREREQSACECE